MKCFPATTLLEAVAIDVLGMLRTSIGRFRFVFMISECFSKIISAMHLRRNISYDVAVALLEDVFFKNDPPQTLLSDNGSQFASHFFQQV